MDRPIDSILPFKTKEGYGAMNLNGDILAPPKFSRVNSYKDGMIRLVSLDKEKGSKMEAIIDNKGNYVLELDEYECRILGAGCYYKNRGGSLTAYKYDGKESTKIYSCKDCDFIYNKLNDQLIVSWLSFKQKNKKIQTYILNANGEKIYDASGFTYPLRSLTNVNRATRKVNELPYYQYKTKIDEEEYTVVKPSGKVIYNNLRQELKFEDGISACIQESGESAIIDQRFSEVIPFKSSFHEMKILRDLHPKISKGLLLVSAKKNNKYGIIDIDQNIVMPFIHDRPLDIKNGFIHTTNGSGLDIFLNAKGDTLIRASQNFPKDALRNEEIRGAGYIRIINENGKYGMVDLTGSIIVPFQFDYLSKISSSKSMVFFQGDESGYLHENGQELNRFRDRPVLSDIQYGNGVKVITQPYKREMEDTLPCAATARISIGNIAKLRYQITDSLGNVLSENSYDGVGFTSEKLTMVQENCSTKILDPNLRSVLEEEVTFFTNFFEGKAIAMKDNQWALINDKGEALTDYTFNFMEGEEDYELEKTNLYTKKGMLLTIEMGGIPKFRHGSLLVLKGRKFGLIDTDGKVLIETLYDNLFPMEDGMFYMAIKDGKYGIFKSDGTVIMEVEYERIEFDTSKREALFIKNGISGYHYIDRLEVNPKL
jgi:hypothetical protein